MRRICLSLTLVTILLSSCKKDEENPGLSDETKQFNEDSNTLKAESDQADNDINVTLQDIPAFGRVAGISAIPVCGVTVDTSQIAQKIVYLDFDSTMTCLTPARTRSGRIRVELTYGNFWRDPGAQLTITYIQFKVKRVSTGRSVTLNGVKTLTNVNGNNWIGFLAGTDSLLYRSRAFNIQVAFSGGHSATWNLAHTTRWKYLPVQQEVIFTATGDTTVNGFAQAASWGTNRFGNSFTTAYHEPLVSNSTCGFNRPVSGDLMHRVANSRFDILLGVDINGNPVVAGCAYGFQVAWYWGNNSVGTAVYPY